MKKIFLTTALVSCLAASAYADVPNDVLVIGKAADPASLDPAVTMDNNDWTVTYPAYQRLVHYASGKTTVEGELASSWTVSDDGLVWDFELSEGNAFADGSAVDAAAVKFSFDRLMSLGQGPSEAFPAGTTIEATGDMSVRFTLPSAFAPFLFTLANNGAGIVNPAVMDHAEGDDMGQAWLSGNTAGSGGYQVTNWAKGQSITLEPNANYGGDAGAFSRVIVKIVPDASARRLQLEAGDLDIAEKLPVDQLSAVAEVEGVEVGAYPSLSVTYLYINNSKPPFDTVEARKALIAAVDRDAIVDGLLLGNAQVMAAPIPDGMWGYDESIAAPAYDPAAAKEAFKSLGLAGEEVVFALSEADPNWAPIALSVQANLAAAGVTAKLETQANASYRDRINVSDFQIAIGNWSPDFSDPYMFMNYWFDSSRHGLSGNRSFYTNDKVDQLIRDAAVGTDQAERQNMYMEAQSIAVDEAAYGYLFQKSTQVAMQDDVEGFVFNPMLVQIYNISEMSKSN